MEIKPILFNTEMVRAILDGRKSCTRRVVKFPVNRYTNNVPLADKIVLQELRCDKANFLEEPFFSFGMNLPYQPGDVLYVRETFAWCPCWDCGMHPEQGACTDPNRIYHSGKKEYGCYIYRASCEDNEYPSADTWHPSIHMPKEAARIWLKVTDARVERLQDMDKMDAVKEGIDTRSCINLNHALAKFKKLWNSTINKSDLDRYGWHASPWVWVIEFERCEKPERVARD